MIMFSDLNYYYLTFTIFLSYLLGSISFGLLITKYMNLGNLKTIGSGNIGATNVLRTGNKSAAALTLILDGGKGYLAIFLATYFFEQTYLSLAGISVFLGHVFPVYHKFKGGKGVATFLGIVLAINSLLGLMTCLTWLLIAFVSKRSSIAALLSSATLVLFLLISDYEESFWLILFLTTLIWWLHKDNIKRILKKSEPVISTKDNTPK